METETLNINGIGVPHSVIHIKKDGACIFGAISYHLYGTQVFAQEIREEIVGHVVNYWNEFSIITHDKYGNNYNNPDQYSIDMTLNSTFGSLCELIAATQLYACVFEVYRNGTLFTTNGVEGCPIKRLRFIGDLSGGHFDVLIELQSLEHISTMSDSKRISRKRRSRVNHDIRKKKNKEAVKKYQNKQPSVHRRAVAKYQQNNPDSHRKSVGLSQQNNPEVHRSSVATYQRNHPEVHRVSANKYQISHPEVHRASANKYQRSHPEVHRASTITYQNRHPEVHRASTNTYQRNNPETCRLSQIRYRENQLITWKTKTKSGMNYNSAIDYEKDKCVQIGKMNQKCKYCNALKWKEESVGMCCSSNKVYLQPFLSLPEPLYSLLTESHPEHKHFMNNIRKYNGCFQMTSFGATQVFENGYMPTFKVQGQVYHLLGSLLPLPQQRPQFLQIYFVGEVEEEARMRCSTFPDTKVGLVKQLQSMLHSVNNYVKDLKTTIDQVPSNCKSFNVVIHADKKPSNAHAGRYNIPSSKEVALVIVGQQFEKRDIIIRSHDNVLKRISELHRSYDALQYPLMFCHGEDGYSINLPLRDSITAELLPNKTVSAACYYAYRIMVRYDDFNHIVRFRSLFSQYLVDMYAKIETERLNYIRNHQKELRADQYIHLKDAVGRQDVDPNDLGQKVVLPSSFTGSPRYMHERTQDAMTYVRQYGRPDLFITFTCNPKWKDIADALLPSQKPHDRHDIIARVFHLKVKKLMALLTKGHIFGKVRCFMYSVEWQKRGLPHIHILLWLEQHITSNMIDNIVCAEIPNPENDILLHELVEKNMIHGPCGNINLNSPCMKNGKCSKRYPRRLVRDTQTGEDGYPSYRRRSPDDGGFKIKIRDWELDNRWVVPYNPVLLRSFGAHVNVEICNSVKSIKYICKYVNKGSDQAAFVLENNMDEVKIFETGRYISSSEAVWRILAFPIHERYPPVFHLAVHLENGQRVYYNNTNLLEKVTNAPKTTLLAFFDLCNRDTFAKTLLYSEVPSYYVWKSNKFERRKRGKLVDEWQGIRKDDVIGRVYTVHPNSTDCYYLRLLLHVVRGPSSFTELKTVNGVVHSTFISACLALGLLEDDYHWDKCLEEAALSDHPNRLRELFAVMLVFCQLSNASVLWETHKDSLSEDLTRQLERQLTDNLQPQMDEIYNSSLILIEDVVLSIGGQRLLQYGMPQPVRSEIVLQNREYMMARNFDLNALADEVNTKEASLTREQLYIYNKVIEDIESGTGEIFFLDAPGGTGKTFLLNSLLAKVRCIGGIALAVASSGIAATLLKGGKTAHAAFKLPLNLIQAETPMCNISKQSNMAKVLRDCKLIVWDESTMAHKGGFEALDRSLKDIRNTYKVMGGVTTLLAGDFRQTLPVVPRGTRADEVIACLKSSYLWPLTQKLSLQTNMRVQLGGDFAAAEFSKILLDIGNGNIPQICGRLTIPINLGNVLKSINDLISEVYPDVANIKNKSNDWLCERAILTPKNDRAAVINELLLSSFEAALVEHTSIDTVLEADDAVHYPVEFLNSLNPPGFPPHKLNLKLGAPIMLLRNIKPPKLCNGTRLRVISLQKNIIEATILTGCGRGETVFIPRIPLIPSEYPFEFKRLQFPVKLSFAITINKSQGQSLKVAGVDLNEDCFSHGQFYVACSRVSSPKNLFILAPEGKTSNVVYKEVLR